MIAFTYCCHWNWGNIQKSVMSHQAWISQKNWQNWKMEFWKVSKRALVGWDICEICKSGGGIMLICLLFNRVSISFYQQKRTTWKCQLIRITMFSFFIVIQFFLIPNKSWFHNSSKVKTLVLCCLKMKTRHFFVI